MSLAASPAMSGVAFLKVDSDEVQDLCAAKGIRALPTFHLYWRGKLQESFSGADIGKLTAAIDRVGGVVDEVLTAEAVAMSMGEGESVGEGAGSAGASSAAGGAPSAAMDEDEDPELAEALRLSMMSEGGGGGGSGAGEGK